MADFDLSQASNSYVGQYNALTFKLLIIIVKVLIPFTSSYIYIYMMRKEEKAKLTGHNSCFK